VAHQLLRALDRRTLDAREQVLGPARVVIASLSRWTNHARARRVRVDIVDDGVAARDHPDAVIDTVSVGFVVGVIDPMTP
jgi:hypothetical protein